jgi:hypothetical protein
VKKTDCETSARALSALHALDPGCAREQWVCIGMAAKAAGLSLEDFTNWSADAANYAGERDCAPPWPRGTSGSAAVNCYPGSLCVLLRAQNGPPRAKCADHQIFIYFSFSPSACRCITLLNAVARSGQSTSRKQHLLSMSCPVSSRRRDYTVPAFALRPIQRLVRCLNQRVRAINAPTEAGCADAHAHSNGGGRPGIIGNLDSLRFDCMHIICPNDAVVSIYSDRVVQEKLDFCREQKARV